MKRIGKFVRATAMLGLACLTCAQDDSEEKGMKSSRPEDSLLKSVKLDLGTTDPEQLEIEKVIYSRLGVQRDQLFEDGEYPMIVASLEYEAQAYPHDYETVTNLGWMLGNVERYDQELAIYLSYHRSNPENPECAYPLGQFYFLKKNYVDALRILKPSLSLKTKPHANSYRLVAQSYQRLGLWQQSLDTWNLYLKLAPDDEAAIRNRNRAAERVKAGG